MDEDLIGQLLDAAAGRLAAYGYLLTGQQRAGEDVVQDAIVKAFVRRRRPGNARAAETSVRATMRAIHLQKLRRATSWRSKLPWADAPAELPPAEQASPGDSVGRALATLTPHERAVVVLRHYDELEVPEIAAAMRATDGAVRDHLSHAHATLSRTLGEIAPEVDRILVVDGRGR